MNQSAVCAGTFDPLTFGHLDVIERAAHIFRVVVGVAKSEEKALYSPEERIDGAALDFAFKRVEAVSFSGLY